MHKSLNYKKKVLATAIQSMFIATSVLLAGCGSADSDNSTPDNSLTDAFNLIALQAANTQNSDASGDIRQLQLTWNSAAQQSDATGITYTICRTDNNAEDGCHALAEVQDQLSLTLTLDGLLSALSQEFFVIADNGNDTLSSSTMTLSNDTVTAMIGYIKASNAQAGDYFGYQVAMSDDGNTLVVGAYNEDSASVGINGTQTETEETQASNSGAVYVFSFDGHSWAQTAYLKSSNSEASDYFGKYLTISADGLTIAVGAHGEDSAATGINGDESDNSATTSGAVYLFSYADDTWTQSAYLKASNAQKSDQFGTAVALDSDGDTLAVAAKFEDSFATTIDGDQDNDAASSAGAVYLFKKNDSDWQQTAYLKASNGESNDFFGQAIALNSDGNTLVASAWGEDANSTGVNGDETDNSLTSAGAAYVFTDTDSGWSQSAYLKPSNTDASDGFGYAVDIDNAGTTIAIGAYSEDSNATGIDGDQSNNEESAAGAVYLFSYDGSDWAQSAYVKASNSENNDKFGENGLALSGDGKTLAVGADSEDSNATGIDGEQQNNDEAGAGAVYVFQFDDSNWQQTNYVKASNAGGEFGISLALNEDGSQMLVSAIKEDSASTGINGEQAFSSEETDADGNVISDAMNYASSAGAAYLY